MNVLFLFTSIALSFSAHEYFTGIAFEPGLPMILIACGFILQVVINIMKFWNTTFVSQGN